MKNVIVDKYEELRASYWFLPSVMAVMAVVWAGILVFVDSLNENFGLVDLSWITLTGASGARSILSTVAGSMITVTGIVFSITIVILSLTSQQFGPRLLQNFMRDRGNQFVLGTVTSTYLYCLVVLRSISDNGTASFVPHLSTLAAVLLAVLCVGVLIYFIHHVAESIQVANIIAGISRDLSASIERLYPEIISESLYERDMEYAQEKFLPEQFAREASPITAAFSGYLRAVDIPRLLQLAEEKDLVVRIGHRVGHFIVTGAPLVEIWPEKAADSEELAKAVNDCFMTGHKRSHERDTHFLLNELVEIAIRALSPGINDPFTAIACVNHLGIALCDLAGRVFPPVLNKDATGRVRVVAYPVTFERTVASAFNQIRQYGQTHAALTIRMLEIIRVIIPFTRHPAQREALLQQATLIERGSHQGLPEDADRQDVHERFLAIFQTVEECFGLTAGD